MKTTSRRTIFLHKAGYERVAAAVRLRELHELTACLIKSGTHLQDMIGVFLHITIWGKFAEAPSVVRPVAAQCFSPITPRQEPLLTLGMLIRQIC